MMDIGAIGDVAEETHAGIRQNFIKDANHRFDRLVIGRNAVAHQPERGGEAIEKIDGQVEIAFLEQGFGSVKSGRTGPDNGNAQWPGCRTSLFHSLYSLKMYACVESKLPF